MSNGRGERSIELEQEVPNGVMLKGRVWEEVGRGLQGKESRTASATTQVYREQP